MAQCGFFSSNKTIHDAYWDLVPLDKRLGESLEKDRKNE